MLKDKNKVTFNSAQEMAEYLKEGSDLYSPSKETYVFLYNDYGSICAYDFIDEEYAEELDSKEDYWGAYLGLGGYIYDSREYLINDEKSDEDILDVYTNLDWCRDCYMTDDWLDVTK